MYKRMDIKTLRAEQGLTQADLAAMLGLTQSVVSRYETGALELDPRMKLALEAIAARPAKVKIVQ